MKHIRSALLALALAGAPAALHAQVPGQGPPPGARPGPQAAPGVIQGTVVDAATGRPVPSASVGVWSAADSALVTGAIAGANGAFRVEGLRPGQYYLKVGALGYTPASPTVALTPQALRADLGAIRLAASAVALEGLEVRAERGAVALAPDRNTYAARELAPAGGTATDVLRSVPSVEVDGDGNVSLRGNSNVAVQLNGRAAPMTGAQLAAFLQQLSANMVERVEVVPNPSAKYDPEGMAGIINIVLKQNTDLGTSGGLLAGVGTGNKYNASGNLGYQRGPLSLFGSYGFNYDERETTGYHLIEELLAEPNTFRRQDILGEANVTGHVLNGSGDLRLGKQSTLSSSLLFSDRSIGIGTDNDFFRLDADRDITSRARNFTQNRGSDRTMDASLAFKRTVQPQRNELSAELRFNRADFGTSNLFTGDSLATDGTPVAGLESRKSTRMGALADALTLQTDWIRPLGERAKLETGYKGIVRWLNNDYLVRNFSHDLNDWVRDPRASNDFEYDEQVHAVYGVLSRNLGKVDMQAGLRAERATSDFVVGGKSYDNDKTSFFPSALVAYNLSDSRQLKASYSKRVQRVSTQLLNPFPFHEDERNVIVGNPSLTPEFTHAFELGYQQSWEGGSLQVTPYFRRTEDAIRRTRSVGDDGVTTSTFANLATSDSYGADVTGSLRLGSRLSGFAGFNAFKMETDGSNVSPALQTDAFTWSARMNATVKVSPTLDVQGMYMYRAPMNVEQGRISAFSMASVSMRQKLRGDKSSLSLRVMDPFNTMGFTVRTTDDRFVQESRRRMRARAVFLTFNYNFGRPPRIRQPRPEQQPDQDPRSGVPYGS